MSRSITLTIDVEADPSHVFEVVSTTDGQRGFWTTDCEVSTEHARFGFAKAPVDLETDVHTEADTLVRMRVSSGFPFWEGSTWEWELAPAAQGSGTTVVFRHFGFAEGYPEADLGRTAQSWAMITDRLDKYAVTGVAQPFFPEPGA
ncbi:MAG TPA: hypothetical protein VGN54_02680 [Mycobacteriales bacterium]|nr:hypothetical protein [Mycobacteriales bacterium]